MKILVPMAGEDVFFKSEDYHFPKPLVEIDGEPMIKRVIDPLRTSFPEATFIFVVQTEECRRFSLNSVLRLIAGPDTQVIQLDEPTKGALCSCLLAIDFLDNDEPLIITNADQIIETDLGQAVQLFRQRELDAGVITFDAVHPRWSYVHTAADDTVLEAAEKRVISRTAVAGFYYFAKARAFVGAAMDLIRHGAHVNGSYYIAPALNELILARAKVGSFPVPSSAYISLYSPQRVEHYERILQGRNIAALTASESAPARTASRVNLVIPMAGRGSRFAKAGYAKPKPFIDVAGRPMIERVLENLAIPGAHYVLIGQREHFEAEPEMVAALTKRSDITLVAIDGITEGSVCTVLLARRHIDNDTPMLIANCDQIVDFDCDAFIADAETRKLDGSILVFRDADRDPKWSFARTSADGLVQEVKEKVAISDLATVGIYYFASGCRFVGASVDMIARNDRTNNEFYTCPVYNYSIADGAKIGVYEIASDAMHGIGTPEDLDHYIGGIR